MLLSSTVAMGSAGLAAEARARGPGCGTVRQAPPSPPSPA